MAGITKTYLLTPGPTPIPEVISAGFAKPLIHHRTPAFEKVMENVRGLSRWLFQTEQEVLLLAATGTGAMEAAVANLCSPGDTILYVNAGKFGERWGKIAQAHGVKAVELKLTPGESATSAQVESLARANPGAKLLCFQASETSTGAAQPVRELCEVARKHGLLSVCDAITAAGVTNLPMDAWGIDVLITGSQKALMIPPGLALIALSERAWKASAEAKCARFYFDLAREKKAHLKNQTAWTPAISLIQGLETALEMMKAEGLEALFRRHTILAQAMRTGVQALGLEVLARTLPSTSVTAVRVPGVILDAQNGKKIPKLMRERYGVVIAGGQDDLEGKVFRLSHFGYVGAFDISTALSALEMTLTDLGYPVDFGKGVGAALAHIHQEKLHS